MQLVHGLHFNNLRGDIYGGLTAAVVALPLALAIGMIMASFLFMQRMVDLQINSINTLTGPQEGSNLSEQESAVLAEAGGRILLFQVTSIPIRNIRSYKFI